MTHPFSLFEEAWLPVATSDGKRMLVRPCDISRPDLVSVATGRPDCDISLTEFLIGLLAVAIPPEDTEAWRDGFSTAPTAEQLQAAFAPFKDALVLNGDGPRFFQDREQFEIGALSNEFKRTEQLFVDSPGQRTISENADHFVKRKTIEILSPAGAAIALLTIQTMSPSGGPGKLTSIRGGGPLTTLVVPGESRALWHRLWANTPSDYSLDGASLSLIFPWLVPTRMGAKSGIKTLPEDVHRAQVFFGMPRRIRLIFSENTRNVRCDLLGTVSPMVVEAFADRPKGTDYGDWPKGHPMSPYRRKDAEHPYSPVHLQSSRIGYREWLGIAVGDKDKTRIPAQCVFEFRRRLHHQEGDLAAIRDGARLLVAGYAMDNMKPLDFGEALMPLMVGSNNGVNAFVRHIAEQLVEAAQETAGLLVTFIRIGLYGERAKVDSASTVLQPIRDRFWADTEQEFFGLLGDALRRAETLASRGGDAPQDGTALSTVAIGGIWHAVLLRHSIRIFDDSVPLDEADSDRIVDIVKARKHLLIALAGYGAVGKRLFKALGLPDSANSDRKAEQGKATTVSKEGAP